MKQLKIGLVVPHIFMHEEILPHVIFAPAKLALSLADGLVASGQDVTLLTPGPVKTSACNLSSDLNYFETELELRGDSYLDLLKKHPFTFITLARQIQSEIIAKAYQLANAGQFDVVHVYTNEEDTALAFASLCEKPLVFTHHDPFNFLVKYKNVFPKYKNLNWLSMSLAQRQSMPNGTSWLANIYHGLDPASLSPNYRPAGNYVAYLGRIIESKGVHLAIAAVEVYNTSHLGKPLKLKIAGKHYSGTDKDKYWLEKIEPKLGKNIEYVGFISDDKTKNEFLGGASALVMPSLFDEPFGLAAIEALACGTPVIGLNSGALAEIIIDKTTGYLVSKATGVATTASRLAQALAKISTIDRHDCRADFEARFTLDKMVENHLKVYQQLANS